MSEMKELVREMVLGASWTAGPMSDEKTRNAFLEGAGFDREEIGVLEMEKDLVGEERERETRERWREVLEDIRADIEKDKMEARAEEIIARIEYKRFLIREGMTGEETDRVAA